jgi:hypothetical protein
MYEVKKKASVNLTSFEISLQNISESDMYLIPIALPGLFGQWP